MPSPFMNVVVARAAQQLPGVRRVPLTRLVILAEIAILAKAHYELLSKAERRRLVLLVKDAKGRPSSLSARERRELEKLIAKVEPRVFAAQAVEKFSPTAPKRRAA